ncbi:protease complex subunit PrcB family protein [Alkaliphilus transvaalensis]|uniref:protease complex subunit PrcB family protein n=1 Tax=Alkaliphilus transvaalensis TaxID=114628 RepID=UPI0004795950|nr:protease complex subunit PrcB family protein [Alkaliphilus transvaalensis]
MNRKVRLPKFPRLNWKLLITVIVLIVLVAAITRCVPRFFSGGEQTVNYVIVEDESVPDSLKEIISRYKMLERALATTIDDQVYVIVTRGEKLTAGYEVDIEKMQIVKEEDEEKLVVYALFTDPKQGELVAQVITHPYVIAKTDLKELPKKIELQARFPE